MSNQLSRTFLLAVLVCLFCGASTFAQTQTTAFSYQGKLTDAGTSPSGTVTYEMQFKVFDAASGGLQQPQPTPVTLNFTVAGGNAVSVTNGTFTVSLDFGGAVFPGANRFLEISVRHNSSESFVALSPRQQLTSNPYAIRSANAGAAETLSSTCVLCVTNAQIQSVDGNKVSGIVAIANGGTGSSTKNFVDLSTNQTVGGSKTMTGALNLPTNGLQVGTNQIVTSGGNVGIGTSSPAAKLHVEGTINVVGLRTETDNKNTPNVIGGFSGNVVNPDVTGATIGGGGFSGFHNLVTDSAGTVGGGVSNRAGDGVGQTHSAQYATVGGGTGNTASGPSSTVGGGTGNTASGTESTVPGGESNTAQGGYSFATGRRAKALNQGAFVWADSTNADFSSTADNQFLIRAGGGVGIGTDAPGYRLDVVGRSRLRQNAGQTGSTDTAGLWLFQNTPAADRAFVGMETDNSVGFFGGNGGGWGLIMNTQTGNVGIGTSAPDAKLSVNGQASKPGGGSWNVFSDERLKNIKGRFATGLNAVMKLQPLRYEYKNDNALALKSEGEHIGFSAQAVQKVIPEAVTKNAQGYLLVNNDPIMWTMLNAIKEQQAQIEQQQQQIEALKKLVCSKNANAEVCKAKDQ